MKETRPSKYGKNLAIWINHTIDTMPIEKRKNYKTEFIEELRIYSFEPRKNGQPPNQGCVRELTDITEIDISNPKDLAKLVKEGIHLMYQKQTAASVINSLLEYI